MLGLGPLACPRRGLERETTNRHKPDPAHAHAPQLPLQLVSTSRLMASVTVPLLPAAARPMVSELTSLVVDDPQSALQVS